MRNSVKRAAALLCCLFLLLSILPQRAMARPAVDVSATCALSLDFPVPGVEFRLYRVASVDAYGDFTLTEDFAKAEYGFSLEQEDQAGWGALARAMSAVVNRDQIEPLEKKSTDRDGHIDFEATETGLYLITANRFEYDGYFYTPLPLLVAVPGLDAEDNWVYTLNITPKYERDQIPTEDIRVHKVWDDSNTGDRPTELVIQLLRDGRVLQEVTLNAQNGWSYQWNDLDKRHTWEVTEKSVPAGYTAVTEKESITYLITNTRPTEEEPSPVEPLPDTGMLWWPVPVLACCGLALVCVGWMMRRRGAHEE